MSLKKIIRKNKRDINLLEDLQDRTRLLSWHRCPCSLSTMKRCDREFGRAALVEHETDGFIVEISNFYNKKWW